MLPSTQNKLVGSNQDDWGETLWKHRKKAREASALYGEKREWTFRKLARRWEKVKKGMEIDIDAGKQIGETSPPEYWARVWNDMHYGHGGPPGNLPNDFLRDKWTAMKNNGKTDTDCWDTFENQYPVAFLGLPLLNRWEKLGDGTTMDETKDDMFGWTDEFNRMFIKKEMKARLEEMSKAGEEETFWRVNWDTIHKGDCTQPKRGNDASWILPVIERDEKGGLVRREPTYKQYYPTEFGKRSVRVRTNSVEDQAIFKEFDFV